MNNVLIDKQKIDILANAISDKSGVPVTMTLDDMVEAVDSIEAGGGEPSLQSKTYTVDSAGTETITADSGYDGLSSVAVSVPQGSIDISMNRIEYVTINGTTYFRVRADAGIESDNDMGTDGYISDHSIVSNYCDYPIVPSGTSVTPTESSQTIGGSEYVMQGHVTVNAIPSNYVGSGITQRSSSDLTASGATVTVPSGYYSAQASKAVSSGSATAPATISGTSATVSTGTNTLTLSKTVSVTPSVTAGYVSSGTAGNSSVSLTASVTTQGAQTIYPSTTDQTISSGRYLTGTQTIKGVSQTNLTADNIKSGTTVTISNGSTNIWSVLGTYTGSGGGGSGIGTLLATSSTGSVNSTSTQAANLNKDVSVSGINAYDLLIVEASVDSVTNGRHCATISLIYLTAGTTIGTKNGGTVASNKLNIKVSSNGTYTSVQGTTAYGIYANSVSISNGTATIPMYRRYNSTSTGTINGTYTTRVYGVKLYDLIGG